MRKERPEFVDFGFTEHMAVRSSLLVSDPSLKVEEPNDEITDVVERITEETLVTITWKSLLLFFRKYVLLRVYVS